MIWFWLIGVACVVGLFLVLRREVVDNRGTRYGPSKGDLVFYSVFGLIVSLTVTALLGFGVNGLMQYVLGGNNKQTSREVQIVQIATGGTQTRGDFFLGTGVIDSRPVYTFYRNDDGAISQDYVPADFYTKIYQDNTGPRVVIYENHPRHAWLSVFNSKGSAYEIHVPEGSIQQNVDLNLSGGS